MGKGRRFGAGPEEVQPTDGPEETKEQRTEQAQSEDEANRKEEDDVSEDDANGANNTESNDTTEGTQTETEPKTETVTRTVIDTNGEKREEDFEVAVEEYAEVLYKGPSGHVEDSVGPYNEDGNRYLEKGKTYSLPRPLATRLVDLYEGFVWPGKEQEEDGEGNADGEGDTA